MCARSQSLDLHQAAHQHLCSSLLKIKGIAESPNLPEYIKPIPKPNLSEEERIALHNVTSALCNRKQVKDIIDEAIMSTCIALRVSMPEKKGKSRGKNDRKEQEQQADDIEEKPKKSKESKAASEEKPSKKQKKAAESEEESWEGFGSDSEGPAGSDGEEQALSRYAGMLAGSSDEDSDGGASDDEDAEDSRARSIRGPSDYFSGSSAEEDSDGELEEGSEEEESAEESDDESDESDAVSPPPKKVKSKTAKAASAAAASGNSTFLPSLMGGYISGSESEASDIDIDAPAKKNRRGQRARQAIWEKKFKAQANHLKNQKSGRDQGWDMKRGAVGGEDAGPWKKGIRNPFEKRQQAPEGVHPDRQANFGGDDGPKARDSKPRKRDDTPRQRDWEEPKPAPKPKPKPKKDDEGPLHASWEAAKKAKEAAQNVSFQGKKVVFD